MQKGSILTPATHTFMQVYLYISMHLCVFMYLCTYMCMKTDMHGMYIHIYWHTFVGM